MMLHRKSLMLWRNKISLKKPARVKSVHEELANRVTHGVGVLLSILAFVRLIFLGNKLSTPYATLTYGTFGLSLCALYLSSFLYHSAVCEKKRRRFKILDHAAIYILIAGTYTPFVATILGGTKGNSILCVIWILAALGCIFKVFFAHRFKIASTFFYLGMGWMVMFVIEPLSAALPARSLLWLVAGGLCYTTGVVFYLWDRLKFQHAIWHLFVLGGSACHVLALALAQNH